MYIYVDMKASQKVSVPSAAPRQKVTRRTGGRIDGRAEGRAGGPADAFQALVVVRLHHCLPIHLEKL